MRSGDTRLMEVSQVRAEASSSAARTVLAVREKLSSGKRSQRQLSVRLDGSVPSRQAAGGVPEVGRKATVRSRGRSRCFLLWGG